MHRFAIIPGIFVSDDPDRHHAFVQVLNGVTGRATYHRYPPQAFSAARDAFRVRVGPNRFALDAISLDIQSAERTVRGTVRFDGLTPWPVTLTSPGIMGWYGWVPYMECYHGVLSLDHRIEGTLAVDGQSIDWTAGRGYIEKDWGRSFASAWVWMQTNHFCGLGTSVTASVAIIPWLNRSFRGFIAGLWHHGQLYRFATYTGARVERLDITEHRVDWVVRDRTHRLEMGAARARSAPLRGPSTVDMGVRVPETLQATIDVRLMRRRGAREDLLFAGQGRYAGLEVAGDTEQLL